MHVSERRACAALGQHRSTQRKIPRGRADEERLTADTIALARQYGRYGYRKIAGLLEQAGWVVNDKRVERIDREPHSGSTATQEITKALRHKVFCMMQGGANAVGGSCVSSTPR